MRREFKTLKIILLILIISFLIYFPAYGVKYNKMIREGVTEEDLEGQSMIIFSVEIYNQMTDSTIFTNKFEFWCYTRRKNYLIKDIGIFENVSDLRDRGPYSYAIYMAILPPGEYKFCVMSEHGNLFEIKIDSPFTLRKNEIVYLGHIKVIFREKTFKEISSKRIDIDYNAIPQKTRRNLFLRTYGVGYYHLMCKRYSWVHGTFDVYIYDEFDNERDVLSQERFLSIKEHDIRKEILSGKLIYNTKTVKEYPEPLPPKFKELAQDEMVETDEIPEEELPNPLVRSDNSFGFGLGTLSGLREYDPFEDDFEYDYGGLSFCLRFQRYINQNFSFHLDVQLGASSGFAFIGTYAYQTQDIQEFALRFRFSTTPDVIAREGTRTNSIFTGTGYRKMSKGLSMFMEVGLISIYLGPSESEVYFLGHTQTRKDPALGSFTGYSVGGGIEFIFHQEYTFFRSLELVVTSTKIEDDYQHTAERFTLYFNNYF